MKKKFLFLISILSLCGMLTSCNLKDAITGNIAPSNDINEEEDTTSKTDNTSTKGDITNNESPSNSTNTDDTTSSSQEVTSPNDDTTSSSQEVTSSTKDNTTVPETPTNSSSQNSAAVYRDCRIFYFNAPELKTYYVDTKVPVVENAFVTALTSKLYDSPNSSKDFLVLPSTSGVKSATLDYDTKILKVVFNEDFTNIIPLGSGTESGLISAIINTYGYNYGVDKVAIYFGDTLYTGLKGDLPEGYFNVNFSDAIKLN